MAKRKNDGYGLGKSLDGFGAELPLKVQRKMQSKASTLERKQKRQEKRNYDND